MVRRGAGDSDLKVTMTIVQNWHAQFKDKQPLYNQVQP